MPNFSGINGRLANSSALLSSPANEIFKPSIISPAECFSIRTVFVLSKMASIICLKKNRFALGRRINLLPRAC